MNEIIANEWLPFNDENFWMDANNKSYRSVVYVYGKLYTADDNPFGSNTLEGAGAKIMHIRIPEIDEK